MNKADLNTEKIVLTPDKHDTQLTVIYSVISAFMYIIGFVSFFISKDIFALEAMIFVGTIILVFILFFQYPYFHRTIIMDEKNITIILGKIKKVYAWENVNIVLHDKKSSRLSGINEILSDGYILSVKKIRILKFLYPTTYCLYFHPYASVFLRFKSEKSLNKYLLPSYTFSYTVEKKKIEDFLKHINKTMGYTKS